MEARREEVEKEEERARDRGDRFWKYMWLPFPVECGWCREIMGTSTSRVMNQRRDPEGQCVGCQCRFRCSKCLLPISIMMMKSSRAVQVIGGKRLCKQLDVEGPAREKLFPIWTAAQESRPNFADQNDKTLLSKPISGTRGRGLQKLKRKNDERYTAHACETSVADKLFLEGSKDLN